MSVRGGADMRESESNRLPGIARCGRERELCIACRVLGQSNIMLPFVLTRDGLWKSGCRRAGAGGRLPAAPSVSEAAALRSTVFRGGTRHLLGSAAGPPALPAR